MKFKSGHHVKLKSGKIDGYNPHEFVGIVEESSLLGSIKVSRWYSVDDLELCPIQYNE